MDNVERGLQPALKAARYFGAEGYANDRRTVMYKEDRENLAWYYGVEAWPDIPEEVREQLLTEFQTGVNVERKYHKAER